MATSINIDGYQTNVPGPYSRIDDSGLDQPAPGSVGILAIGGTARSGRPVSAMTSIQDIPVMTRFEEALAIFSEGDLREACAMAFTPAQDTDIPGGAQRIYGLRVNPATKSTGALGTSIDLASADWGADTEQVNVSVATGTTRGKKVTVKYSTFADEVGDNLGGTGTHWLTASYYRGTLGYNRATLAIETNGRLTAKGERDAGGADNLITVQVTPGDVACVKTSADHATARGKKITVYGLDNTGATAPQTEVLTLNASDSSTAIIGTKTWSAIYGVELESAFTAVVLEVRRVNGAGTVVFDVPAGTTLEGVVACAQCHVNPGSVIRAKADAATTRVLIVFGTSTANAALGEKFTLAGTTEQVGTVNTWAQIDRVITGNVEAARTATVVVNEAVKTDPTIQTTIQKVADYFNARSAAGPIGFVFVIATGQTNAAPTKLDEVAATSILNPTVLSLYADRYAIIDYFNAMSRYVVMTPGVSGTAPANTSAPVYLRGGVEGTVTSAHWDALFTLIKKLRVNTFVPLTGDPAIHAKARDFRDYMAGPQGRKECDVVLGLQNAGLTDVPTKAEILAATVLINNKGVRAVAQAFKRFDTKAELREFQPYFLAVLIAAAQAGSPVGTSLTAKALNIRAIRNHSSWDVVADAQEMIGGGLVFLEPEDQVGFVVVRNVTTYQKDNNLGRIEASVVEILDHSAYRLRAAVKRKVARRGLTQAKVLASVKGELDLQVADGLIVSYRSSGVKADKVGDKWRISAPVAPEIPSNFFEITLLPILA